METDVNLRSPSLPHGFRKQLSYRTPSANDAAAVTEGTEGLFTWSYSRAKVFTC